YIFLTCILSVNSVAVYGKENDEAIMGKVMIPFPLPTKNQRLLEDAGDSNTTMAELKIILGENSLPQVVVAALRNLGERGEQRDLTLINEVNNPDPRVKAAARVAKEWIESRFQAPGSAASRMVKFLQEPHADAEALIVLEKINTAESTQAIAQYFEDNY